MRIGGVGGVVIGGTVRLGVVAEGGGMTVRTVGGGAGRVVGAGTVGRVVVRGTDSGGRVVGATPVCLLGETEVTAGFFVTVL